MIAVVFLVMNMEKLLKEAFLAFLQEKILSGIYRHRRPFAYNLVG
jgi:hypothetical protein